MNTSKLPNWFRQWWDYFGALYDLLQPHPMVEYGYTIFKQNYKSTESEKIFPPLLLFCSKFFVPWICLRYFDYNTQHGSPHSYKKI
jgi:hypothetical protein